MCWKQVHASRWYFAGITHKHKLAALAPKLELARVLETRCEISNAHLHIEALPGFPFAKFFQLLVLYRSPEGICSI